MENRSLDDFLDGEDPEAEPASAEQAESADPGAAGEGNAESGAGPEADARTESSPGADTADTGGDASTDTESESEPEPPTQANADATRVDPDGVEAAATTYAAGAGECPVCGETVRERWRGEAGLVCPACKEW